MSACMIGTHGSGVLSSAGDMLVRGVGGVSDVCMCLARGSVGGEGGEWMRELGLRSSRALIFSNISVGTGSVFSRYRPEGMWCDAALRIMAHKIFSTVWQLVFCSACLQSLNCISPSFPFSC